MMVDTTVQILHLEDSFFDHELVVELVKSGGWNCAFHRAQTRDEFLRILDGTRIDVILADHTLPAFDGLSALRLVRERGLRTPFILVTGSMEESMAIQTFDNGATDYILKDRMARLVPAIHRALRDARAEEREIQAARCLRQQAILLEKAHDAIMVCHLNGTIRYWNQGAEQIYGWKAEEVVGEPLKRVLASAATPLWESAWRETLELGKWAGELVEFSKSGDRVVVESSWTRIETDAESPSALLIINTDATEKKNLEEQFLRAQRMESIGILSGGIAHDLNNVLVPVLLGSQLLRMQVSDAGPLKILDSMERSAQHGAELIKQILAFARGVEGQRVKIALPDLIEDVRRLLADTLPRSIEIAIDLPSGLWSLIGSPTQLTQVLMNLCLNARDSMGSGGRLRITAENVTVDETYGQLCPDAKRGAFVAISVIDSGTGIPPALIEKLYQPFFTTKEYGKGTGLGLSTVKSIVKRHDGFIHIYSEMGSGTSFKVYFPASDAFKPEVGKEKREQVPKGHGEGILVVDDEPGVLNATRLILESHGYRVLAAQNAAEALQIYSQKRERIQLLLTDAMMPGMTGPELIKVLMKADPDLKVIIFSGLIDSMPLVSDKREKVKTLKKPFDADALLRAVNQVIGNYEPTVAT